MPQGIVKKAKASQRSSQSTAPKKGRRAIPPKKSDPLRKSKITKKISAGLTARTERNLAEKAVHLELLAGGKKERLQAGSAEKSAKR